MINIQTESFYAGSYAESWIQQQSKIDGKVKSSIVKLEDTYLRVSL